ncbi:MAG: hypothetical protein QOD43_1069 [Gaiellaceae bacterium]|jgi:hypothetical protein|nr:hypothetical protein [Gaiellaceae bacterium]
MRLRLVALCGVVVAFLVAGGTAGADSGTFSGSITPTACGPLHPITVVAGETTIDAVATADVAANDITLELYDPSGVQRAHGDTATSPEEVVYQSDNLATGVWHVQVCPFSGGVIASPYSYNGAFSTSNAPVQQVTPPGSTGGGSGGTPIPRYVAGRLVFSPATVIDPQRTEGEPLNFLDPNSNTYWESGPWGTTTQTSFIHRSTDNGLEFHVDSPVGLRPDAPPGGGDTDIVVDDQGNHYFVDLEALVNLGTAVSNDNGNNWRKNPVAVQNAAVDRQWYTVDNGTTASAADNTVFLAFHETAVGTYIYSSPGSTGPTDPVGGLVWQNASAEAPRPLANDATCAQIRFDKVTRNLYYACNEGTHVRVTIGHVAPGQRTGIQFHNVTVPDSPGGGGPGHLFPAVATDSAGTVYTAWIDTNDNNVYYSYSTDQGTSWTTPVKVNSSPANTAEFLWAQAGTPGTLALAWYATDTPGQPDSFPNWVDDPLGATTVKWWGYAGVVTNAASLAPTIAQQRFTEKPMHYGQICNQGIGCTVSGGDRTMADYFAVNFDRNGALRFVYNDTTSQNHGAHLYEVRQIQGKTADGRSLKEAVPKSPMKDASGDAQWPHYSPTGAGSNQPQLDFTNLALSQPSSSTLRVKMTVANLAGLQPPPGKTSAVWLTRFQALSLGDFGEEAYRIFYVGAESTAGLAPQYFAGSTTCTDTTPQNCKLSQYPRTMAAQGRVCGNTISVDVPVNGGFGLGVPVGKTLYNVTAFSFGRNNDNTDVYSDVDATHAFDFALGGPAGGGAC